MLRWACEASASRNREVAAAGASALLQQLTVSGYVADGNSQEVADFDGHVRREGHRAKEASESLVREAGQQWC